MIIKHSHSTIALLMTSADSPDAFRSNRRQFLRAALAAGAGAAFSGPWATLAGESVSLPFTNGARRLVAFPQKKPMILLTSRPPQLETPFSVFNQSILTPNDLFFVRYHLSEIPTEIDPATFRLQIKGKVNSPLSLSLKDSCESPVQMRRATHLPTKNQHLSPRGAVAR